MNDDGTSRQASSFAAAICAYELAMVADELEWSRPCILCRPCQSQTDCCLICGALAVSEEADTLDGVLEGPIVELCVGDGR